MGGGGVSNYTKLRKDQLMGAGASNFQDYGGTQSMVLNFFMEGDMTPIEAMPF